ncbi:NAD(P)/FAD-dependent oxidoreductase [Alkalilimnicola sp. S0819]|uniref:NAD(P)/FAD-dependent oxidoreductase n=1 Tax=Alkalilimnicola sp. S0819 TaxID=2613922 RepID=UPI00126202CB|nr:NAD(P)/FAD-dependent oxidoreductase [Alkalilimnicola sp. S0819]KAB7628318.1 NAD(P)/FAD-dependent oxidoreductase [Alkalilimnicola sp. S0819]MPQ15216.1 aminoacetone oxidase family FAD-binding enzyme [Alkalilimnicola sp. S0819]
MGANQDVIVIGAGAAGLMCAIAAGRRGRRVRVLDHANKVGKKILLSGGGRCNFTNYFAEPGNYLSANPHFCKSALSRYTQWDFIALMERHGIAYHEKTLGQLFCDNSARDILDMLLAECAAAGVEIHSRCEVTDLRALERGYELDCSLGTLRCESLVIATGGLSFPKMGASGFGYRVARQFGLRVTETRAALVPFTLTGGDSEAWKRLAGVSLPVEASCAGMSFRESLLFTHRGLSGPAMLQISSYWRDGDPLELNLLPDADAAGELLRAKADRPRTALKTVLGQWLPARLVDLLAEQGWFRSKPLQQCAEAELRALAERLQGWSLRPAGTEGYRTAEVTLGGVDTDELSSRSLEARRQPGLYFIGEVVDVTGQLGGFNFQWAWASGHCAGQYV